MKKIVIIYVLALTVFSPGCAYKQDDNSRDDRVLIGQMNALEGEGRDFEDKGDFESAMERYKMACEVAIKIYGSDKGRSLAFLARVYEKQGRYQEALPIVVSLLEFHPAQENYQDWVEELHALISYQTSGNRKFVQDYIQSYIKKHQTGLPPAAYDIDAALKITRVLALCDMIGDNDRGIQYIDMVLDWAYTKDKEFADVTRVHRSVDAVPYIEMRTPENLRIPNWREYKWVREYLLVREAFVRDKANGTKGSASMALIQSDYFPW